VTKDGIEPRGPNTFRIKVGGGRNPETGRYEQIRETFHGTRSEVKRRRDELRVEVARGTAVRADDLVGTYLPGWIAARERLGAIRPKVAYTYAGYVRREVTPRIGRLRLDAVRPAHVQRVIDEALAKGLSPRSVTQVQRILHASFRDLVRLQVLHSNPCDGVNLPRVSKPKLRVPAAPDVARLLEEIDPDYRAPLAVNAGVGLRRGETLALTWSAVDLDSDRPHLRVEGTLQRTPAGLAVLPPKTERSERNVPLPASLVAMLRRHRAEQNERRLIAGEAWGRGDYVFDRGDGRPVDPDAFGRAFRAARDRAGLDGVRLHDVRHSFASLLVNADTNPRVVSDLLGHAQVSFTLATYFHPDEDAAVDAIAKAEQLLGLGEGGWA
jgi:integrase